MLVALALLGSTLLSPAQRRPAPPPPPPPPPPQDLTLPPEAASLITILEGRGVQIYTCTAEPTGYRWIFTAPEAQLFNLATGKPAGTHGAGPTWTLGSDAPIKGTLLFSKPAAIPADVPWLLLRVQPPAPAPGAPPSPPSTEAGAPQPPQVSFVRRYNTHGGAAPLPATCDAEHVGTASRVPYSASYAFYAAPGAPSLVESAPTTPPPPIPGLAASPASGPGR